MLPILYQDAHLIAIDKPAGLLVHRSALDAGETRFAVQLLRDQIGQPVWPAHRLDKGTSGVLIFTLSADVARTISSCFESGQVRKTYQAVVRGWPPQEGTISHPLARLADDRRAGPRALEVQPALTRFSRLARYALPLPYGAFAETRCALLELKPETGRRHQLRRHCKHLAHPIIGDATHGKGPLNRALAAAIGVQRLWLHACALELTHPLSGAALRVVAPAGAPWQLWQRWQQGPLGEPDQRAAAGAEAVAGGSTNS